ncbi:MAG: hypothetical protein JO332_04125 [Planctomycetaceae bacterium]|nr:hypothetical protein [Planctomycetaceae bacterium]
MKTERRGDPRTLSDKHPGRSKIQDDPPPLTPRAVSEKKEREQKERFVTDPVPTPAEQARREARGRAAMPYGTKGSRKGRRVEDSPPGSAP